jgi:LPXTG-motif cell wall-anchored protein
MKRTFPPHRRALAALVPTLALLAVPAIAQETTAPAAPQQSAPVAPPPVVQIAPVPPPVQSAPVQMVQTAPVEAAPVVEASPERTVTRAAPVRAVAQRSTTRTRSTAVAPVAVTAAPAAAPVAASPVTTPAVAPAPVGVATRSTTVETQAAAPAAATSSGFNWSSPWLALIGVALIALSGLLVMGRRRRADHYEGDDLPIAYDEEEVTRTPVPAMVDPIIAPVAVPRHDVQFLRSAPPRAAEAPLASHMSAVLDETTPGATAVAGTGELVAADAHDVAALTAGDAPVADRPWLEMAMRPLRAGTNVDEALVEIELTVGNSGSVSADDVRISTFMFAGAPADDEMERLLRDRDADAVPAVRIKPGEGRTIEAILALPRASLNGSVSPVIVAEARYSLADGSEGRTSASFRIGVSDEGGAMTSVPIGRPHMHDEVSAELFGIPEHA